MYATADEDGDAVSSLKILRECKLGWKVPQGMDTEMQAYFSHALYVSNDQTHIADQPGASNPVDDSIKIKPDDQLTPFASPAMRLKISVLVRSQIKRCATFTLCTICGGRRGEMPAARPRYRNINFLYV